MSKLLHPLAHLAVGKSQHMVGKNQIEMVALLAFIMGALVVVFIFRLLTRASRRRNRLTAADVADRIERHILETEEEWDWDEFTSIPIANGDLDKIRMECIGLEGNREELRKIVERLRNCSDSRRVAPIPMTVSNHAEGAPGPSAGGPGLTH